MEMRFKAGDAVEVRVLSDDGGGWREATIQSQAAYRGREGYYILWALPPYTPSWMSRGGWVQGISVRAALTPDPFRDGADAIQTLDDEHGAGRDPWVDGGLHTVRQ